MSSQDRERDREFELELLRIQLEHERNVAAFNGFMMLGFSMFVFSASVMMAILQSTEPKDIPILWRLLLPALMIAGGVMGAISAFGIFRLEHSEKEDIEKLRKKYLD